MAGTAQAGEVTIQGEAFSSAEGKNVVYTPAAGAEQLVYPAGSYMAMLSNGKVYSDEYFGQTYQGLVLRAQTHAVGWCAHPAHVIVTIDGEEVINSDVSTLPTWSAASNGGVAKKYSTGWHRISVTFDNDSYVAGQCDVNLLFDSIYRTSDDRPFGFG